MIDNSRFVEKVTLIRFDGSGELPMRPDGFWYVAILKSEVNTKVPRAGLPTRTAYYCRKPGCEILSIAFKPGVFMPHLPAEGMVDNGVLMETIGKSRMRTGKMSAIFHHLTMWNAFFEWVVCDKTLRANSGDAI